MQVKIGNDIIEVERIKKLIEKNGERFLNKVYTENEIEYCTKNADITYQHFAARFAAKEAVFKAVSDLYDNTLVWKNIEIINASTGKPSVILKGMKTENFEKIQSIDISLSHIKETAIASVVVMLK